MLIETVVITASMIGFAVLPIFLPRVQAYGGPILLFGTGSLLGIFAFDLIPDFYKMGGLAGLPLLIAVWVVYSLIHLVHDHHHLSANCEHARTPYTFFAAITAHCFTSGLLLGVSNQFTKHLAETVFVALLVHKIYEAITVSTILLSFKRRMSWMFRMLAIYLLSFPTGVIAAYLFNGIIHHAAILLISSLAIGSLAGCLVFDFILPSVRYARQNSRQLIWLLAGLVLALVLV